MTLIWAESLQGADTLASVWRQRAEAQQRQEDTTLPAADRAAAFLRRDALDEDYSKLVDAADKGLSDLAEAGQPRTHVLVVGVGQYATTRISPVTTSVHGARKFVDWILTPKKFNSPERPLGSVELCLSPTKELGDWKPSDPAVAKLGLQPGDALSVEAATFQNIKGAFERLVQRGQKHLDNAIFFYFAGHGVWKGIPFLLPADSDLPTGNLPPTNLIDIRQTLANLQTTRPRVQYMFLDACQELSSNLLQNVSASPGEPLRKPTNGSPVEGRDAGGYFGSCVGRKAYGPEDEAPYFTQELVACLERRAARHQISDTAWNVTTGSLREAISAAGAMRGELESKKIAFENWVDTGAQTAELCQIENPPEVFLSIGCRPKSEMAQAKLYIESNGQRLDRAARSADHWYTAIAKGPCSAGVSFDVPKPTSPPEVKFDPWPPVHAVQIPVQ